MKALRQKATERNPDEFAFGMMSSSTKGGVRIAERGRENGTTDSLSMDVAKLLKTQDLGYLQTVLQQTKRERSRVEEEAVLAEVDIDVALSNKGPGKRKMFDEEGNPVPATQTADEGDDDDDEEDSGSKDATDLPRDQIRRNRQKRRLKDALSQRLQTLASRDRDLSKAVDELQHQRARMHGTTGGSTKTGAKFKIRERKK